MLSNKEICQRLVGYDMPIPHETRQHLSNKCHKSIHAQFDRSTPTNNLQSTINLEFLFINRNTFMTY